MTPEIRDHTRSTSPRVSGSQVDGSWRRETLGFDRWRDKLCFPSARAPPLVPWVRSWSIWSWKTCIHHVWVAAHPVRVSYGTHGAWLHWYMTQISLEGDGGWTQYLWRRTPGWLHTHVALDSPAVETGWRTRVRGVSRWGRRSLLLNRAR
ncbi:hypothetical protein BX600DRAFT_458965 [Xylariales sp. PMI_506]|nr:hypothetical protein BX600DRAFT_458965 [Xylariales sp. PMI_506]